MTSKKDIKLRTCSPARPVFKSALAKRLSTPHGDLVKKAAETFRFIGEGFSDPDVIPLFDAQAVLDIPPYIADYLNDYDGPNNFYTNIKGHPDLREVLMEKARKDGLAYCSDDHITITAGAVNAFSALCYTLCDEGDVILALAPTYILFANAVQSFGARMELVDAAWNPDTHKYTVSAWALEQKLARLNDQGCKVKALFMVNPRNIDGDIWDQDEIDALADIIHDHQLPVIEDRVYAGMQYDMTGGECAFLGNHRKVRDQVITIDSVSKRFGATQWRVGWMFGPKEIVEPARDFVMQTVWSPAQKYQLAAAKLLRAEIGTEEHDICTAHQSYFEELFDIYTHRRDLSLLVINGRAHYDVMRKEKPHLTCPDVLRDRFAKYLRAHDLSLDGIAGFSTPVIPKATMFLMIALDPDALAPIANLEAGGDLVFARILYQQTKICLLPPNELTMPMEDQLYRIEYGIDLDQLFTAFSRLQSFMQEWADRNSSPFGKWIKQAMENMNESNIQAPQVELNNVIHTRKSA